MTDVLTPVSDMVNSLMNRRNALAKNVNYYEAEARPEAIGLAVPVKMRALLSPVDWARMYVTSIEERLDIEGFRMGGASEADDELWSWWQANNLDDLSSYAHTEALLHGIAYVIVSSRDNEEDDPTESKEAPRIIVESPVWMWADIHPVTGKVIEAIRVKKVLKTTPGQFDLLTHYRKNDTLVYSQGVDGSWTKIGSVEHNLGVVPVVPIVNRARISDTDGFSQVTTALRKAIDDASRLKMNLSATAELMAVPQRVLFGVDPNEVSDNPQNKEKAFEAYIARIMAFADPEGKAVQFQAAELRNFAEGIAVIRQDAASATGLPMGYFAISSDNPASADAIRLSETRLIKTAERKQRLFGSAWEQVMRIAKLIMGQLLGEDEFRMETVWRNAATPTYSAMADAVVKLATATGSDGRTVIPVERARVDLGYSQTERDQMAQWDKDAKALTPTDVLASLVGKPAAPSFSSAPGRNSNPNPEDSGVA